MKLITIKKRHLQSILGAVLIVATVSSCRHKDEKPDPAVLAAKAYYEALTKGKYEEFVDAHYQPEAIPPSYREQLIANAKMFIGQQKDEHQGIDSIGMARIKVDSIGEGVTAFLTLYYGDKTREDITVPMVKVEGKWMMK